MLKSIITLLLLVSVNFIFTEEDSFPESFNSYFVHTILSDIPNSNYLGNRFNLILFVNFADFYCPHCIDDFLLFSDMLKEISPDNNLPVTMILRRNDFQSEELQIHIMNGWKRGNDIPFPFYLDIWDMFTAANIEKTSVLMLNRDGEQQFYHTFPLGLEKSEMLINIIKSQNE